jgi:hypothetical protein
MVEFVDVFFLLVLLSVKLWLLGYFFLSFELLGFGHGTFFHLASSWKFSGNMIPLFLGVNLLVPKESLGNPEDK